MPELRNLHTFSDQSPLANCHILRSLSEQGGSSFGQKYREKLKYILVTKAICCITKIVQNCDVRAVSHSHLLKYWLSTSEEEKRKPWKLFKLCWNKNNYMYNWPGGKSLEFFEFQVQGTSDFSATKKKDFVWTCSVTTVAHQLSMQLRATQTEKRLYFPKCFTTLALLPFSKA